MAGKSSAYRRREVGSISNSSPSNGEEKRVRSENPDAIPRCGKVAKCELGRLPRHVCSSRLCRR